MALTIEQRLSANRATAGFDYLRIGLAITVVIYHSITLQQAPSFDQIVVQTAYRPVVVVILFMFFALGGYLVTESLYRNTIPGFIALRTARLFPGLIAIVLATAFCLGPLFTTFTLHEYFTGRHFFSYFLNMVVYIHFQLPGVFLSNPVPEYVNEQLWTLPFEVKCYIALAILSLLGLIRQRYVFAAIVLGWMAYVTVAALLGPEKPQTLLNSHALVSAFFIGALAYIFRDKIILSVWLFVACIALTYLFFSRSETYYLGAITSSYCTVYLGLLDVKKIRLLKTGDYSYGVYVASFPIQQAIASFPSLQHWWINMPLSLLFGFAYAIFSWHVVEKPFMLRKKEITAAAEALTDRLVAGFAGRPALIQMTQFFQANHRQLALAPVRRAGHRPS
jgi:peptidoglycan/LPS O-acetylase OafA/YrhL